MVGIIISVCSFTFSLSLLISIWELEHESVLGIIAYSFMKPSLYLWSSVIIDLIHNRFWQISRWGFWNLKLLLVISRNIKTLGKKIYQVILIHCSQLKKLQMLSKFRIVVERQGSTTKFFKFAFHVTQRFSSF